MIFARVLFIASVLATFTTSSPIPQGMRIYIALDELNTDLSSLDVQELSEMYRSVCANLSERSSVELILFHSQRSWRH